MELSVLEGTFIRLLSEKSHEHVESLADAQGVMFLCPKCFETNHGPVGTHGIICWFRNKGVPDSMSPGPGRWDVVSGTSLKDLTLSPSVLLPGDGCEWHGWVKNGRTEG